MTRFRFQDFEIWQMAIEIADELFDIADDLEKRKLYRFADQLRGAEIRHLPGLTTTSSGWVDCTQPGMFYPSPVSGNCHWLVTNQLRSWNFSALTRQTSRRKMARPLQAMAPARPCQHLPGDTK